jgi:hypothetical protein
MGTDKLCRPSLSCHSGRLCGYLHPGDTPEWGSGPGRVLGSPVGAMLRWICLRVADRPPMLAPCSLSLKPRPLRSAPSLSRKASCRPPSRCAGCSLVSQTTFRRGNTLGRLPAGVRFLSRLPSAPGRALPNHRRGAQDLVRLTDDPSSNRSAWSSFLIGEMIGLSRAMGSPDKI